MTVQRPNDNSGIHLLACHSSDVLTSRPHHV
jgi:hypothetical protein